MDGGRARGPGARRRGDLPADLPHPGAHARRRTSPSRTSTGICRAVRHPRRPLRRSHAARRHSQQGLSSPTRPARCCARPATGQRTDDRELVLPGPRQRRRVLLPAPARHRDLRRLAASSTSASPAWTSLLDSGVDGRRPARARVRARRPSASPPARARSRRSPTWPARGSPPSYAGLLGRPPRRARHRADVVKLDGAVENAVGSASPTRSPTSWPPAPRCAQAGLAPRRPVLESEAVLVRRAGAPDSGAGDPASCAGCRAYSSPARYVMLDYDVQVDRLDEAVALTPGIESPTVSPLHGEGWVAVHAMVPRARGAPDHGRAVRPRRPGILVTDIHACRL